MSKVKIQGNASGTGVLTVTAPNTSTDRTITLPDSTGTLLTADGDGSSLTGVGVAGISSSADATAMTITSAERIGINHTTPDARLEIDGGNETALKVKSTVAGEYPAIFQSASTNSTPIADFRSNGGTTRLQVLSDGRGLSQFTAKAWANCKQTGTQSIRDSHNVSSIVDMEVGGSKLNFSNNMASATFVTLVSNQWGDVRAGVYNSYRGTNHTRWYCVSAGGQTQVDADTTDVMVFGD